MFSNDLKEIWDQSIIELIPDADQDMVEKFFQSIVQHYSEDHRKYHTLQHLFYVIKKWQIYKSHFNNPASAVIAFFYHDYFHDPARSDNERCSADQMAEDMRQLGMKTDLINDIYDKIMATKDHETEDDLDSKLIIDIDMAILSEAEQTYAVYAQQIKEEYEPVHGSEIYRTRRLKFLNGLKERDEGIFLSEALCHLNGQARHNIDWEIDRLNGTAPSGPKRQAE